MKITSKAHKEVRNETITVRVLLVFLKISKIKITLTTWVRSGDAKKSLNITQLLKKIGELFICGFGKVICQERVWYDNYLEGFIKRYMNDQIGVIINLRRLCPLFRTCRGTLYEMIIKPIL